MVSAVTNLGAMSARRYLEINTDKATRSTQELASGSKVSNPSYDPSAASIGFSLSATLGALTQASKNVSQATSMLQMATGTLGNSNDVLTRMKIISTQANTDTIGDTQRAMLQQEFAQLISQIDNNANACRWGGVSLFTGGAGTASANGAVAQAATGAVAGPANTLAGTMNANSSGMITGQVTATSVTAVGANYYVSVTVGNQVFAATTAPTAGGVLTLVSTTDGGNIIELDYDAAVTGISSAATFQSALQQTLGLASGVPASIVSLGSTGGGMAHIGTFTPGGATQAGVWALTYTSQAGNTGQFKLTNGLSVYTANLSSTTATMAGTVTFGNGVSFTLDGSFNGTTNHAQETYTVTSGTALQQQFQYAEKASDILVLTFSGATSAALGLSGQTVTTKANGQLASNAIDTAQATLNSQMATLGGKFSELNYMTDSLRISIENQSAARSTFVDANISDSMMDLTKFKGLASIAGTVFTQALQTQADLAQMVGQVR